MHMITRMFRFFPLLALAGASAFAHAQAPSAEPEAALADQASAATLAGDALVRLALTTLRDQRDPQAEDYARTALALRIAQRLFPEDVEMLRLERDAWIAAGDKGQADRLLRRIITLDPQDSVAQLQVLTGRIHDLQDADARLAAYDRLLSERGAAIDPAIRSRLALDSALLLHEQGEVAAFVDRLTLAATLDITNKEAATLYAVYFLERTDDPLVRADLLANIVLADPVDASALTNLAHELLSHGAYRGARRFFNLAQSIIEYSRRSLGAEDLFDRLLCTWMVEGADAAIQPLEDLVNRQQSFINSQIREAERTGDPPPQETVARLPPSLETVRLAIAFGRRNDEAAAASARNIVASMQAQLAALAERNPPFDTLSPEETAEITNSTTLELVFVRLWGNIEIDRAEESLNRIADLPDQGGVDPDALRRFRGLIALRKGELDNAEALLAPLVEQDRAARIGLALVHEQRGDTDAAVAQFAQVALRYPNTAIGCAARKRIESLLNTVLRPTPTANALDLFARDFAPWLESVSQSPHNFQSIIARHVTSRIGLHDRVKLRIRIRNIANIPLALGPEQPINSRLLISPNITIEGRRRSPLAAPEIVNLDRRLRLMPREELEVTVWATRGLPGLLLEQNVDRSASVRWRIFQGFRLDETDERRLAPGAMCISTESDIAYRDNLSEPADYQSVTGALANAQGIDFLDQLLLAAGLGVRRAGMSDTAQREQRAALAAAILDRVPDLDKYARTIVATHAFRSGFFAVNDELTHAFERDASPYVNTAMLLTIFRLPDSEGARALLDSPDADIRAMARAVLAHRDTDQPVDPEGVPTPDDTLIVPEPDTAR